MAAQLRAHALPDVLAHGLAALAGGSFYGSGEVGFDLQPEQSISSKRADHDVATPQSLRSLDFGMSILIRQASAAYW